MSGGVTEVVRYRFAKDFLEAIGYSYIWDFLGYALVVGFAVSIAYQLLLVARGGRADFVGVVIKYALMALFIQFAEPAVHSITTLFVESHTGDASIDRAFMTAFNQLQSSFNSAEPSIVSYGETHPECRLPQVIVTNLSLPSATLLFTTYSLRFLLFFLFIIAWMAKVILFSWVWPILFSFAGLGLVSAIVFSSIPGGGRAIFPFFKSMVQLSIWPLLYVAFISLIAPPINIILKNSQGFLLCPSASLIDSDLIALFVALVVILCGIVAIPFVASSLMHHRGSGSIGKAIGNGSVQMLNSAVQMLEKGGGGVVSTGISSVLSSASHSVSIVSSPQHDVHKKSREIQTTTEQIHTIVSERKI